MPNERIILVRGSKSNWYEQAIFIVKKDVPQNKIPVDFVMEAERIINNYMCKSKNNSIQKKQAVASKINTKTFDLFLNTVMLLSCIFIAVMLLWRFT